MRIHLPLHPHHFLPQTAAGPSAPPLVQLGGDLVLVELQGELSWEGDRDGGVVGVLGLDRPEKDKPTLHLGEHHLLHGKILTLQRPYAVIRRVVGRPDADGDVEGEGIDGDADEEEDAAESEAEDMGTAKDGARRTLAKSGHMPGGKGEDLIGLDDEEYEPPLFPPGSPRTPSRAPIPSSSSPVLPPSSMKDYSSELDFSSPRHSVGSKRDRSDDEDEDEHMDEEGSEEARRKRLKLEKKMQERRAARPKRTRYYEVVGVVRKKVVFALRPEPIVTATILPE